MAHKRRFRQKGVPFSGSRYIKRVGISLVDVYKRVGKSVIWATLSKGPKGLTDEFLWLYKDVLLIDSYLKDSTFTDAERYAKF